MDRLLYDNEAIVCINCSPLLYFYNYKSFKVQLQNLTCAAFSLPCI